MPANEIGLAILGPLRDLDDVAYLRFSSVYKQFDSADDFEAEIADLRATAPTRSADRARASCSAPQPVQRLTTDHPVRRGEAAYRVHHLGAPWQPCGYVGAISNNVQQGPTRVGTEEHRHMTETVSGAAKRRPRQPV